MKQNNFVPTLSPQQQYEIRRWLFVSILSFALTFVAITCYFLPQLYNLMSLKKEVTDLKSKTKNYTEITNARSALKKEQTVWHNKKIRIDTYVNKPKNPHAYITTIMNACNNNIIAELIRHNKKNIEITIACPSTECATVFAQQLNDSNYFSDVKITSLQQHDQKNKFKCIIKGVTKKM